MAGSSVGLHMDHAEVKTAGRREISEQSNLSVARDRSSTATSARHMVAFLVTPGTAAIDIVLASEAFRACRITADSHGPARLQYDIRICAAEPGVVHLRSGFRVDAAFGPTVIATADTVFVPSVEEAAPLPNRAMINALRQAHLRGRRIVASRSGVSILAAAGILSGRAAASHWLDSATLRQKYPETRFDDRILYIRDGNIITTAGAMASIETCIDLIRCDYGAAAATRAAQRLLAPLHRTGESPQFVPSTVPSFNDDGFSTLLDWIVAHLRQPLTLADLSREARMSPRTLARRFEMILGTTPMQWVLGRRIHLARQLLETTREPMETIAQLTGLGSAANLRLQFTRHAQESPQRYRTSFQTKRRQHQGR